MSRSPGPLIKPSTCPHSSEHCSPSLSHLKQRVPHLFGLRRAPRRARTMSHSNTSGSIFKLSLQDDPDDSLLWDRWTGKAATSGHMRVFYPNVNIPAERLRLFLRFELSLALATADEPSEAWIRKFGKLLEKAYRHFDVEPEEITVTDWLDSDVATIVDMIATHPAGRNLRQFSNLAQKLVETQGAFPDPKRLHALRTLLLNIAKRVNALPEPSLDQPPHAAPADMISFVGSQGELDEDLREVWEESMNLSDMEIDSTGLLHPLMQAAGPLTEMTETDSETQASVEHSTDREDGADHGSRSSSQRQQARTRSSRQPRTADRSRSPRQQLEGSGERPGSPLAAQDTGGSGGGSTSVPKRKSSHASQGSFKVPGSPHIKASDTWSAEVQSLKDKLADQTAAFEAERRLMREQLEQERAYIERERAGWERERESLIADRERERESLIADRERERELLIADRERERELLNERVAELKERVAELKVARQKA
ncbi:hypothetical protein C8T65DRAFT_835116 [Cerioporus squamosus]|nr:hypothetical protein C8T65DRAFT_835116 [Cerioporus squamosus]